MSTGSPVGLGSGSRMDGEVHGSISALARWRLTVVGTVQGVGFRPHVHRLATQLGLAGFVGNDAGSVFIEVEGPEPALQAFGCELVQQAPPLARVRSVTTEIIPVLGGHDFAIAPSRAGGGAGTTAPPDTAPCADCLREISDPADRRHRYPFTTCTSCGPRFTIITALPYDRPATTMAGFPLCGRCATEYGDPTDRRFHAQPVACPDCGPQVRLVTAADPTATATTGTDAVLAAVQVLLADGAIVALKGIGGFHLACRADDERAVARLRQRKHRPGKPLAVMVPDLEGAGRLARVSRAETALLTSPAAPIVLLRRRADRPSGLAEGVAPGNPLVGVMLPSSPLHHLLFAPVPGHDARVPGPLVMTSGNLSEEPLCTADAEAMDRLAGIADAWVLHDRPIAVPCDDSVVRVDVASVDVARVDVVRVDVDREEDPTGQPLAPSVTIIRRSRGYVPTPLPLPYRGVAALAVGGQLKTTAALTDGYQVWLSPHIGDMGSLATLQAFERTIQRFSAMHEVVPHRLVTDAHPEYTTRRWAHDHADGRPVVQVQHHHAHIAAVMAEHGLDGSSPVIGLAFDGTGYGPDGTIWGGEALLADYDGYRRLAHLSPVLLPGGDAAIRHPRRTALSHLRSAGIAWDEDLPPVAATAAGERRLLAQQLQRALHSVPTSSMGRLFDAVASLLDVRHDITFEAQAAIEVEVLATTAAERGLVPLPLSLPLRDADGAGRTRGSPAPAVWDVPVLIRGIVEGVRAGTAPAAVALGVHHAIATAVLRIARAARQQGHHEVVALSGGVFVNALLTQLVTDALTRDGFTVIRHRLVPPNDGGLALGQLAIGCRPAVEPTGSGHLRGNPDPPGGWKLGTITDSPVTD